jgi:hypothetical protein
MDVRPVGPRCPFQRLMSLPAPHPHPLEAPFPGEIWTASPPGKARVAACGWCTVVAGGVAWFRPRTKFFTSKSFFSPSSSPSLAPSFCDCRHLVVLLHFLPLVIRPSILRYSFFIPTTILYYFLPFSIPSNYSLNGHSVALNFDHHLFKTFLARCRGTFPSFRVRKKIDFFATRCVIVSSPGFACAVHVASLLLLPPQSLVSPGFSATFHLLSSFHTQFCNTNSASICLSSLLLHLSCDCVVLPLQT